MPEDNRQFRSREIEFRAEVSEAGDMVAEGMAILYGVETVLWRDGDFEEREVIAPGAARQSIANDDWRAVWNHRADIVLGRMSAGTLTVNETESGVAVRIQFPDTEEGRSKFASVKRGDVKEMSFMFVPTELAEEKVVENGRTVWRTTITEMTVYEVSPVTFPQYETTSIAARAKQHKRQVEAAAAARDQAAAAAVARGAELRELELQLLMEET